MRLYFRYIFSFLSDNLASLYIRSILKNRIPLFRILSQTIILSLSINFFGLKDSLTIEGLILLNKMIIIFWYFFR